MILSLGERNFFHWLFNIQSYNKGLNQKNCCKRLVYGRTLKENSLCSVMRSKCKSFIVLKKKKGSFLTLVEIIMELDGS